VQGGTLLVWAMMWQGGTLPFKHSKKNYLQEEKPNRKVGAPELEKESMQGGTLHAHLFRSCRRRKSDGKLP